MWDRQQRRRENDTRWQEIHKIISNFWWRKLSDFRFESDNFFMRKLERILKFFLGSFARVQEAHIQWWIAFKNCNFQLNLPFFCQSQNFSRSGHFFCCSRVKCKRKLEKMSEAFNDGAYRWFFFHIYIFPFQLTASFPVR